MGQGQSKCVNFSKGDDLEKKIQELHDNALRKIDELNKKHVGGGGSCINSEGLEYFLHQIKNKMLLVAVVGEGSSGKSTLINAFLRERILPVGVGKVTGFRIFIGHDSKVHDTPCDTGHCDKCPYLVRGIGNEDVLCRGVKNIQSKITEENKSKITEENKSKITKENQLDDEDQKDPFVIYTYIPLFDSLSSSAHFTPYLVDSPGVEVFRDDIKSYYSILSAMIYVENYQRLLQNEENIKKELGCKPESASLFFAVSHFDDYYTSCADEPNPNKEETKDKVHANMKLVKPEEVFPVCGLWALYAHLALRYNPTDKISRVVEVAYNWIPKNEIATLLGTKVRIVLETSAIKELEEKLRCSIEETKFEEWNIKMCEQCQTLLKGPIQAGEAALKKIQAKIADSRENIDDIKKKIKTAKIIKGKIENISKDLEKSCLRKILSTKVIKECTGSFRSSCIDGTNGTKYTFGQCLKDWDVFSKHDLHEELNKKLTDETKRCFEEIEPKFQKEYKTLQYLLGHDPESMTNTEEDETQEVNCSPIGEPSKDIKDFVSSKIKEKKSEKYKHACFSAATGVGVGALFGTVKGVGLLSVKIAAATASVASAAPIVAGGAFVVGLCGAAYFVHKGATSTVHNVEMSKEEVNTICDKMNSQIITNSDETQEAVKNALRGYSNSLKAKYDQEWGSKLNEQLQKAEALLKEIEKEEKELKQALTELEECNEVLKVSMQGLHVLSPHP